MEAKVAAAGRVLLALMKEFNTTTQRELLRNLRHQNGFFDVSSG